MPCHALRGLLFGGLWWALLESLDDNKEGAGPGRPEYTWLPPSQREESQNTGETMFSIGGGR